jgi:hypothetical protein
MDGICKPDEDPRADVKHSPLPEAEILEDGEVQHLSKADVQLDGGANSSSTLTVTVSFVA